MSPLSSTTLPDPPVLAYDFDMPAKSTDNAGYYFVPNIGSAGNQYDLLLGRLPKQGALGAEFVSDELSVPVPFVPPAVVPFAASSRDRGCDATRPLNPAAPMVVLALGRNSTGQMMNVTTPAGHTLAVAAPLVCENDEWGSGTVLPASRSVTEAIDADGSNLVVHVLPYRSPFSFQSTVAGAKLAMHGLVLAEDTGRTSLLFMMAINPQGSAAPHTINVTAAPIRGSLFAATQEMPLRSGEQLPSHVNSVTYEPPANLYGRRIDSFAHRSMLLDHRDLTSAEDTTHIMIEQINDLPTAAPVSYNIPEDFPHILNVTLSAKDAETGHPLDLFVSKLPTKGKLYPPNMIARTETGDWALAPNATPIFTEYNAYSSAGRLVEQWASRVIAVSSFWGNPPGSEYHPIHILGPPDCSVAGECQTEGSWTTDITVPVPLGQRVTYSGLLAQVIGNNGAIVELDLVPMFKHDENGVLRRCAINPEGAAKSYPADCSFETAASGSDLGLVVPRAQVAAVNSAAWSPRHKSEFAGRMVDCDGAFGSEYMYDHSQTDGMHSKPQWTEFIEVGFDVPVYILGIELGSPRGPGHVASIKARTKGQKEWTSVFWDGVQEAAGAEAARTTQYYRWSPQICRLHLLVDEIRIEVDTRMGTGDWNYIDYVQLIGTTENQLARLATGTRWLAYVPHAHANGQDLFAYQSTDCPSMRLRSSMFAEVSITIEPVNDAPTITLPDVAPKLAAGGISMLKLPAHDHDHSDEHDHGDDLQVIVTALPRVGKLLHAMQAASGDIVYGESVRVGDGLAQAQAYLRFEEEEILHFDEEDGPCSLTMKEALSYVNSSLIGAAQQSVQQTLYELQDYPGDLRVCLDEISYDAVDSAGLTASATYPIVLHKVAAAGPEIFIPIAATTGSLLFLIFLAGAVYGIVRLVRTWRHLRKEAIELRQNEYRRLAQAAEDIVSCKFNVCFVKFSDFREFGEFRSHETVRRAHSLCGFPNPNLNPKIPQPQVRHAGQLIYLDTYDDVMSFTSKHATLFISHQARSTVRSHALSLFTLVYLACPCFAQWLGWAHPDPDSVQYPVICQAAEKILREHDLTPDGLYMCTPHQLNQALCMSTDACVFDPMIGLDYSSIPQRNVKLQQLSIATLTLYASTCQFFVIVAPTTTHHDTGKVVNLETYQRRGCGGCGSNP